MDQPEDVHVTPLARLRAWIGPPRSYVLTRWLILRLLGVVYLFAFLGLVKQGLPLLGEHGLTPAAAYLDSWREGGTFWDLPTVFWFGASDTALLAWAVVGLVLAAALVVGYANLPSLAALWLIYGSYERIGQLWWSFGWEIQLLETTVIAACLVHPWDPRPLRAPPPPAIAIVLMRWLAFRIMLGAGLIKLRGDACWTALTCLDAHFETQPIPNPLSPLFHHLPHAVLAGGVVVNHIVEVVLPWFAFGPRLLRLVAAFGMAGFQIILIASGNLAFLNWLTLVPVLALFDDDMLVRLVPRRLRDWLRAQMAAPARNRRQLAVAFAAAFVGILLWMLLLDRLWGLGATTQVVLGCIAIIAVAVYAWRRPAIDKRSDVVGGAGPDGSAGGAGGLPRGIDRHQLLVACMAGLIAVKSWPVIVNLAHLGPERQAMNRSYDRLALVNTYGAFGSVGMVRNEIIIEGTLDSDPATARWSAYELPCKPGDLARRPCLLGPYHLRLDWLIWFAAMHDRLNDSWVLHLVWKLLDGDQEIRKLIAVDPFDGKAPRFVRIRRFVYHLQAYASPTWWTRDHEELWLSPVALDTPGLRAILERFGLPSPSLH